MSEKQPQATVKQVSAAIEVFSRVHDVIRAEFLRRMVENMRARGPMEDSPEGRAREQGIKSGIETAIGFFPTEIHDFDIQSVFDAINGKETR